jgi:hypothetical protein
MNEKRFVAQQEHGADNYGSRPSRINRPQGHAAVTFLVGLIIAKLLLSIGV